VIKVMRPDLERALREHLPPRVDVQYATTITAVHHRTDGVAVTLTDGTTLDADLLIGCAGIHSTVRQMVFGPDRDYLRYLGFHTAAFTFPDPAAHAEVDGRFCLTDTLHRAMGRYGLRDGRVAVFAVHPDADPALPADPRTTLRRHRRRLRRLRRLRRGSKTATRSSPCPA
jgi:2-polyprenyl-6-methoxyphenol hydroxylase-like FAD-dependent oxidoreductase